MKTKSWILSWLIVAVNPLVFEVCGDELDEYVGQQVSSTNGVIMGVRMHGLSQSNTTAKKAILFFKMAQGRSGFIFIPKPEFIGRIILYDSKSNAVPKTKLGKSYGRTSKQLKWDKALCVDHRKNVQLIMARDYWRDAFSLPAVSELFEIENPGAYVFVLEFQVLLEEKSKREIVTFPRIEIPVTRLGFEPVPPGKLN